MTAPLLGICGWKNSGKTTLVVRLVEELTRRGHRISTVKHAHHAFDIDHEGTDSFRHRLAGASEVAIVSARRWALIHESRDEDEPSLDRIVARLSPCDLIVVEGYKSGDHPKIELRRRGARQTRPMSGDISHIVAIASDQAQPSGEPVPHFDLDDIGAIADFAERFIGA